MRVLILGGAGMLGHKLWQTLKTQFETFVTLRCQKTQTDLFFAHSHVVVTCDVCEPNRVDEVFDKVAPGVVVNCIGVVKQAEAARDPVSSITVNALFPHLLARACRMRGIRLVHISTDCVFSGRQGRYREEDTSDADDLYGRTKYLGEIGSEGCLTLRTSMIGRELATSHGLVEWFLAQNGKAVRGFKRAIFSGLTTHALAQVIQRLISDFPQLSGIYHLSADPICKYELLNLLGEAFGLNVQVELDETFVCDRSLDGSRFRAATGLVAPSWPDMIRDMADDPTPYAQIRRKG